MLPTPSCFVGDTFVQVPSILGVVGSCCDLVKLVRIAAIGAICTMFRLRVQKLIERNLNNLLPLNNKQLPTKTSRDSFRKIERKQIENHFPLKTNSNQKNAR